LKQNGGTVKNKNFPIVILVLLVLCLLALCVGGFLLWRRVNNAAGGLPNLAETAAAVSTQISTALPEENTPAPAATSVPFVLGAAPVIHLAGRTDIPIPPLDQPSEISLFSCRPAGLVQETYPPGYRIQPGAEFTFTVSGKINYYAGAPEEGFPPDGDPATFANIEPFGGISGYQGPGGALVGVFLDDAIPNGAAPATLNFNPDGQGTDFERLQPQIGQVFFIGDGQNSAGKAQVFVAPPNATRLFVGLIDGSFFSGPSTCYTDNAGEFKYQITSNQPYQAVP
jgi:hypothetical protein